MAQATIIPPSVCNFEKTFTPDKNIKINSIQNPYLLPLNFKEGDTIEANTELKFNIDGWDDFKTQPVAIIDYTEL
jgi:hypothetical protein|tara:strand:+ start:238 stop:462 length:225 start_codon:yes stop_codon:yes gene_type:complete